MPYAQVAGWGMAVPSRIVTNKDIVEMGLETTEEWIETRTGIRQRRLLAPGEATSDLAVTAAQRALEVANVHPADLDLIIVATCTPDHPVPATASLVQDRIGAGRAGATDLNAACSGFVYAISLAAGQIESARARQVLVIGADAVSIYLDWQDRETCILFGDGAGALLLQPSEEPGILSTSLGSDGSGASLLMVSAGGSRFPIDGDALRNGDNHLVMDGRQIFRLAAQMMGKAAEKAIEASGLTPEDVNLLIPHQANGRIIEAAAKKLGLPPEKVYANLAQYGNTTAASIPIALCEAIEEGRVKPGDNIVLTSFGAGLSWGSAVIRWGLPLPVEVSSWRRWRRRLRGRWATFRSSLRKRGRKARSVLDRKYD